MKKQLLALATAILTIGLSASCSKIDDKSNPDPVDDGSKRFVVLSDIHLMHPDKNSEFCCIWTSRKGIG